MRATFIAVVCLAWGCAPSGPTNSETQDPWSGSFVGRLPADGSKPSQTVTSDALADALGGYKLQITEDRQFLLEARGRVLQGKVEEDESGLTLIVERVFGMTRQQLLADRNRIDDVESDLRWFDKKLQLRKDGEGGLRLEPDDSEGETVVFTRELPKS
ncbi:MAG: hypothetical protein KF884_10080 [Fimbriimonadaceae bacterium]|nr:hypothetical protein [Fimbriimonadaceae bacterium]QYK57894.1 MAG: hypothetical protein KF884_10080 [Fimbriimonadaceae bacterium]